MSRVRVLAAALSLGALAGVGVMTVDAGAPNNDDALRTIYCYKIIRVDGQRFYEPIDC